MTGPVIAIDGPAGSGKSTVARELARRLGLDYLDTGAMYRSVAFAALQRGVDPDDAGPISHLAQQIAIEVGDKVLVDGYDATIEIRGPEVTRAVSTVAANPEVRTELRDRQRAWAEAHGGGVIEGRDIGTVVFPSADLKVYLTADDTERARRRHQEASALHYDGDSPGLAVETVQAELARRDRLDSTRETSPLAVPDDAVIIDTTGRTVENIVDDVIGRLPATATPGERGPAPLPPSAPPPAATASPLSTPTPPAAAQASPPHAAGPEDGPDAHGAWRPTDRGRAGQAFDRALYAFCRRAIDLFARSYWRLEIEGRDNLPATGSYVVAPVHRSNVDTPLVSCITTRRMRFMGKDSLWKHRAAARFFSALGGFPVHRGSADRDALRRCIEVLRAGEPLVVFPEGTRQSGPVVQELFEGAAYVATRTGVPIVPVGIGGSELAMPKGAKGFRRVKVVIVIGEPIAPATGEGRRGSRRAVREVTDRLATELQLLFDRAQVRAGQ